MLHVPVAVPRVKTRPVPNEEEAGWATELVGAFFRRENISCLCPKSNLGFSVSSPDTHYLPKGQTIDAEYYSSLLVQLKGILKEKRRGNFTKGVLFLHDNAPAHRALATQMKLAYLGFKCLDHSPYSTD